MTNYVSVERTSRNLVSNCYKGHTISHRKITKYTHKHTHTHAHTRMHAHRHACTHTHTSGALNGWLPLNERIRYFKCVQMYNIMKGSSPHYLKSNFKLVSSVHERCTQQSIANKLYIPRLKTNYGLSNIQGQCYGMN